MPMTGTSPWNFIFALTHSAADGKMEVATPPGRAGARKRTGSRRERYREIALFWVIVPKPRDQAAFAAGAGAEAPLWPVWAITGEAARIGRGTLRAAAAISHKQILPRSRYIRPGIIRAPQVDT